MTKMLIPFGLILTIITVGCAPRYQAVTFHNKKIDGLEVSAVPTRGVLWDLTIRNDLNTTALLLWDECSYVSTSGQSHRIVRGNTRVLNTDRSQPKVPIAGHSFYKEKFVAEDNVSWLQYSSPYQSIAPENPGGTARVILMFELYGKKECWVEGIKWVQQK